MRFIAFTPALFLALTACLQQPAAETLPPATEAADDVYKAIGTEPGWLLEIDAEQIRYLGDYGETRITVATPQARPSFNGTRYVSDLLTVDITKSICNDGMSDRRYADRVTVSADGNTVSGCGGNILPPENLDQTRWRITAINGNPPSAPQEAAMDFTGGQLAATVGCNRFSAAYTADAQLITGPARATRMACSGKLSDEEAALSRFFESPASIRFTYDGSMLLDSNGQIFVLEQII